MNSLTRYRITITTLIVWPGSRLRKCIVTAVRSARANQCSLPIPAGETYSESIEMEAGLVTADKEDYHPQRMCPTLTRHRSVQLTRQQKAWRSALLGSIADDHKAEDMCSTLKRPSCSPIGQECLNNGGGSPSEVPSALADERSWCDGDRSFTVYSGWSCLGFLISLCHCIPVGEGTYTQGKSVNTNLICMEKVTVISSDSKSLWATQPHKESLPPNIAVKSRH
ncbi:hypothetical protein Q8A67_024198 [Cirrhinus molitorella]|uniref:Uncharacterized protein n=1 Tax=Cirrhinus molitorella TaxID=172907 RepID=A0AA88T993_9TELE|nr:hypothetical protein Q8A67_024198 [Cirrhinus molitorella]